MPCRTPRSLARRLTGTLVAGVALAGCFTGERPSFDDGVTADAGRDDPAIAAVLDRLGRAGTSPFTAQYDIIPSTTGAVTKASVRRFADGRQRITIGDVRYVIDGSVARTCSTDDSGCVDGTDEARISDLNITSRFWGTSFADRLRLDAARQVGDGSGHDEAIAGQPATCADVPVLGGSVTYCALDEGVLARYFGADVSIELTFFSASAPDATAAG